jgi:predicted  nucleic acid-binding Zn-ribbon protein
VQSLKQRRSNLEDEILVLLDDHEAQQATLLELANTRDREHERWAGESVELRQRLESIAVEEAAARSEREQLRQSIDAPTLAIYDTLRARKGVAVARLRGSTCSACRVQVPDADRRRVLDAGILARCSNCERILVFGS